MPDAHDLSDRLLTQAGRTRSATSPPTRCGSSSPALTGCPAPGCASTRPAGGTPAPRPGPRANVARESQRRPDPRKGEAGGRLAGGRGSPVPAREDPRRVLGDLANDGRRRLPSPDDARALAGDVGQGLDIAGQVRDGRHRVIPRDGLAVVRCATISSSAGRLPIGGVPASRQRRSVLLSSVRTGEFSKPRSNTPTDRTVSVSVASTTRSR